MIGREMQSGIEVIYTSYSDADRFLMAEAKFLRALGAPKVTHQVDCVLSMLCLDHSLSYLGIQLCLHSRHATLCVQQCTCDTSCAGHLTCPVLTCCSLATLLQQMLGAGPVPAPHC